MVSHTFSNMANFLEERHPTTRPNWAYFSNVLALLKWDPRCRSTGRSGAITLEWGPGVLASQETAYVILAIGLALPGPEGFPRSRE